MRKWREKEKGGDVEYMYDYGGESERVVKRRNSVSYEKMEGERG